MADETFTLSVVTGTQFGLPAVGWEQQGGSFDASKINPASRNFVRNGVTYTLRSVVWRQFPGQPNPRPDLLFTMQAIASNLRPSQVVGTFSITDTTAGTTRVFDVSEATNNNAGNPLAEFRNVANPFTSGAGEYTLILDPSPIEAPPTPSVVGAEATGNSVKFTWRAAARAATYVYRYKKSLDTSWTEVSTTNLSETVTGLEWGAAYDFQVQAANAGGTSAFSTTTVARIGANPNPPSISGLVRLFRTTTLLALAITIANFPTGGSLRVFIRHRPQGTTAWTTATHDYSAGGFSPLPPITGLPATTYEVEVSLNSDYSDALTNTFATVAPPVLGTILVVTAETRAAIEVPVLDLVDGTTIYYRYRESGTDPYTSASVELLATDSPFSVTLRNLKPGTTYELEVSLDSDYGVKRMASFTTKVPPPPRFAALPTLRTRFFRSGSLGEIVNNEVWLEDGTEGVTYVLLGDSIVHFPSTQRSTFEFYLETGRSSGHTFSHRIATSFSGFRLRPPETPGYVVIRHFGVNYEVPTQPPKLANPRVVEVGSNYAVLEVDITNRPSYALPIYGRYREQGGNYTNYTRSATSSPYRELIRGLTPETLYQYSWSLEDDYDPTVAGQFTTLAEGTIPTPPMPDPPGPPPEPPPGPTPGPRVAEGIMLGDTDITGDVISVSITFGGIPGFPFGSVYPTARGVITLDNHRGTYNPYNPAEGIDPTPGVPVQWLEASGTTLVEQFNGFSLGLQASSQGASGERRATLGVIGPLGWLKDFEQGLYTLNRSIRTGFRSDLLLGSGLDDLNWPADRRHFQQGEAVLNALLVQKHSLTNSGGRRVSVAQFCQSVALAELGRIFDDRRGDIVFENRNGRGALLQAAVLPTPFALFPGIANFRDLATGEFGQGVVNIIQEGDDPYISAGEGDVEFAPPIPAEGETWTIPPGGASYRFNVNIAPEDRQGIAFIQSWKPLVRGTHFRYPIVGNPFMRVSGEAMDLFIPNLHDEAHEFTLLKVEGERFRRDRAVTYLYRNEASIGFYGPKPLTYPNLTVDVAATRTALQTLLAVHAGVTADGNRAGPPRQVEGVVELGRPELAHFERIDISSLVTVRAPEVGVNENTLFFVDGYTHEIDEEGSRRLSLILTEAVAYRSLD